MNLNPFAMFQTQPAAPAPAPMANPAPGANTPPLPNVDPNNPTLPADQGQDPFKDFQKMWDIDPTKVVEPDKPFFANIDNAKVMEAAKKTAFTSMTQEQMTAIQAGGPEALKAMQAVLNTAAQNVYGQSAIASTKMIDQALEAQRTKIMEMLPALINKQQVTSNLNETNPIFTNPAIAPMVSMVRDNLLQKNPNAQPAEINKQISDFFDAMGTQFAPKSQPSAADQRAAANQTDWEKYFTM